MTLRTNSATRFRVVSRSKVVFTTSATSSSSGSTLGNPAWVSVADIAAYDNSRFGSYPLSARCYRGSDLEPDGNRVPMRARAGRDGRSLARDDADIGQVAIALRIVQAVAHNELIGNFETDVIGLDGLLAPRRLVQQGGYFERAQLPRAKNVLEIGKSQAGVENVLHQNDILIAQRLINVFGQTHLSRRVPS